MRSLPARRGGLARWSVLLALAACAGCTAVPGGSFRQGPGPGACSVPTDHGGVVVGSGVPGDPSLPEPSSGYRPGRVPVSGHRFMVVSAHPLATLAGCEVLRDGGSAADAAVAVQMVLGLVEPQSSGLGGGSFALHYDAATRTLQAYDGRETAPAAATENDLRWIGAADRRAPLPDPRASGRSIGTPGTVAVLDLLQRQHGRRPWAGLFDAAIRLADDGFAIGGRMADAIAAARTRLRLDPDAAAYFLTADLGPKPLGTRIRNPAYADTLRRLAAGRSAAFYRGEVAADIVAEIGRTTGGPGAPGPVTPGRTTLDDLARYAAVVREPVCTDYRAWRVCGMAPPSSGGLAVAQTLGMLASFDLGSMAPEPVDGEGGRPRVAAVHLVSEAERLAFADRDRYVADTDFVPLPGEGIASMLDASYLRQRAAQIRPEARMREVAPGSFPGVPSGGRSANEGRGTSQVSIVDAQGNAVSMTTTIESSLGSYRFVRGFLLNNELTDFSFEPSDQDGPIANRLQPGKRPRSSMAPTLVFRRGRDGQADDLVAVTGSPGGAAIIPYVVKTLVGLLDWGLDAQQASALVNFGATSRPQTLVGGEHPWVDTRDDGRDDPLVAGLRALGHAVSLDAQSSGVATILRRPGSRRWQGGADPRREGLALGD
jgi:gamma-glutamyltranspeptidase/glutathione hydrolase